MKVYLREYIYPPAREKLAERAEIVDTLEPAEEIDAVIIRTDEVPRSFVERAKNLKVIGKHGVGCNTIDLEAAKEAGVPVINTPTANMNAVAELIVGLMLDTARNISYADRVTRGEGFSRIAPPEIEGLELTGKTVGLVGMGNIARRVGEILKGGFGVKLVGYDTYIPREQAEAWGIEQYDDLKEMLAVADLVNISVPLTPETKGMIAAEELKCMKPTAILINAARGGIVDEDALFDALEAKTIRAAACDAFVEEPPNGQNKLMGLDNFVATPHIGADSSESLERMGEQVVDQVLDVLDGHKPARTVNGV